MGERAGISSGVEADSTVRLCVRGGDGVAREIPMRQATETCFEMFCRGGLSVVLRAAALLGQLLGINNVCPRNIRITSRTGAAADGRLRYICEAHGGAAVHYSDANRWEDASSHS